MTRKAVLALLTAGLLACSACSGVQQSPAQVRYYTLEYAPPVGPGAEPLGSTLRIERFQAAPVYAGDRIVYRENPYERRAYTYHRWRSPPSDLVTFFLTRDLQHSGVFAAVVGYDSRFSTSYAVQGGVEEFLETDEADQWQAVLTLSVTLLRENEPDASRRVIFQRIYHDSQACDGKKPAAVAKAMSIAFSRLSAAIGADIYAALVAQGRS